MNILNKAIVQFVKILPKSVVYLFAKRYIAGKTLPAAMETTKKLNSKSIVATMDVLGEAISTKEEAIIAKQEILELLQAIHDNKLDSNVSVKPTQLGLLIDKDFCYDNVKEIVLKAKELNNFIRLDMEDSPTTDLIIELYRRIKTEFENVGIVVQAYLKRTIDDIKQLNKEGGHYRLCKGIYIEPEEIAFKKKQEVRDKFLGALELMLDDGNYVGIATHDKYLIDKSYQMIKEKNISKDKFEFQMLYGVKERLRDKINDDGFKIRIYVPFGEHWYAYSIRRLQENPVMAWHITKSIFTFGR
ncbi:MAG: proline dehydrogenase family protein [Ignavibacteriales bacterium]|nr:proline dehydrogenase family protein [Ignavibacteriales bacterium]